MGSSPHVLFHRLAVASAILSIITLVAIAVYIPRLAFRASTEKYEAGIRAERLKEQNEALWSEFVSLVGEGNLPKIQYFSRAKRATEYIGGNGFCKGCMQLACPTGPPGPPGAPGGDGKPGDTGAAGNSGDDGFDVQLESEPELPCVVCPSGPQGPRGAQGERGRQGEGGPSGIPGPDGFYGRDGPTGSPGQAGRKGGRGEVGLVGPPGEMAVSGVGIKGPKGPPGPAGPKGRPGPRGKNSYSAGEPGPNGPQGPPGVNGGYGEQGAEGTYGAPGEPGMPSAYCPSDCGVSHIMAGNSFTSGMLGEKMSAYEEAAAQQQSNAVVPEYKGYLHRRHDFVEPLKSIQLKGPARPTIDSGAHVVFLDELQ